jgi:hypothetical protein
MKPHALGITGCVIGLLGVIATILSHHVIDRPPEQPPSWEINLNFSEKLNWRYGNAPPAPPPSTSLVSRDSMQLAATVIGSIAILFAVASWIRREGISLGLIAAFLGAAAIAWEIVVVTFALFVFSGFPAFWFDLIQYKRREASKEN